MVPSGVDPPIQPLPSLRVLVGLVFPDKPAQLLIFRGRAGRDRSTVDDFRGEFGMLGPTTRRWQVSGEIRRASCSEQPMRTSESFEAS